IGARLCRRPAPPARAGHTLCIVSGSRVTDGRHMGKLRVWQLVKESFGSWRQDRASSMGGALAYYTLFSIAPMLIIVIAIAGFFLGEEAARGEIVGQLRGMLGDSGAS